MKLRNKKTGDIKDACEVLDMKQEDGVLYKYYSLAELNEEWEDYEEPKDFRPEHLKRMNVSVVKVGKE